MQGCLEALRTIREKTNWSLKSKYKVTQARKKFPVGRNLEQTPHYGGQTSFRLVGLKKK